jgi:hypothetical protein
VRHSDSGLPGGTVTVVVTAGCGLVRVEVADRSGSEVPVLRPPSGDADSGRGLESTMPFILPDARPRTGRAWSLINCLGVHFMVGADLVVHRS